MLSSDHSLQTRNSSLFCLHCPPLYSSCLSMSPSMSEMLLSCHIKVLRMRWPTSRDASERSPALPHVRAQLKTFISLRAIPKNQEGDPHQRPNFPGPLPWLSNLYNYKANFLLCISQLIYGTVLLPFKQNNQARKKNKTQTSRKWSYYHTPHGNKTLTNTITTSYQWTTKQTKWTDS